MTTLSFQLQKYKTGSKTVGYLFKNSNKSGST